MKHSLTLAFILSLFATNAMAETTPSGSQKESPSGVQHPMAQVPNSEMPHPNMYKNMGGATMDKRISDRSDRTWQELDTNNDGYISKEESIAFSKKKFEEKDANRDDKVTRAEWDAFREKKISEIKKQTQERKAMGGNMPMGDTKITPPTEKKQ